MTPGDRIGDFDGTATLINSSRVQTQNDVAQDLPSAPLPVRLHVMPSVLIQRLRSVDADCQAVTKATTWLDLAHRALDEAVFAAYG